MTDSNDSWPMPNYDAGPRDMIHALGVIAIEYNKFEAAMFGLFRHHLAVLNVPREVIGDLYGKLNEGQRMAMIESIFLRCEKDQVAKDCVTRLVKYFNICATNRNILMHSTSRSGHDSEIFEIEKRSKADWLKLNYSSLTLETLRRVADDMARGFKLVFEVFWFIQTRDGQVPPFFPARLPPAIPDNLLPSRLELSDR